MKNRKLIAVVLFLAVALSWVVGLRNLGASSGSYDNYVRTGKKYADEQLYVKALDAYTTALTFEDNLPLRLEMEQLYQNAIKIGEITDDGNLVALYLDTMAKYREEPKAYETACTYFKTVMDYDNLSSALKAAGKYKVSSKSLTQLKKEVQYAYEQKFSTFPDFAGPKNGYYIFKNEKGYYATDISLNTVYRAGDFISVYSANQFAVAKVAEKVFIVDGEGVRQKYLPDDIVASGGISCGNIVCKSANGKYAYYDSDGKKKSGDYVYAGRFAYGVAAVQETEGVWSIIDTKFNKVVNANYEDVKLNSSEECVAAEVLLVQQNGIYSMLRVKGYDAANPEKTVKVEQVKNFSCADCDLPVDTTGSNSGNTWFAFKENEKWGFADTNGKVTIKPKFVMAKSFSNGLAAISEDGKKWGFCNESGDVAIKCVFMGASYFNNLGACLVQGESSYWSYIRMYFWG